MAELSIIIVAYNSEHLIEAVLSSIYAQQPPVCEIIVIDNGSADKTVEVVRRKFPQALVLTNGTNEGPCTARNQGIALSKGDWILTLDCDTVLEDGFISRIQEAIRAVPDDVGMIQPKIMMQDRRTTYSLGIHLDWMRRFFDVKHSQPIIGACAAAAVYRRKMLEELKEETGYFDERFFFLVEDVDLAWRAHKRGWKAVVCPGALCCHNGNSSGADKKLRQYLCFRNRLYSIAKNEGFGAYAGRVIPLVCYDFPRFLYLVFSNAYVRNDVAARIRNK